jgi:hypothetical protein
MDELIELDVVEIGDCPEGHAVVRPVAHLEAAEGSRVGARFAAVGRGPHEHVDRVLPALIDERGNGAAAEIVEPSADQREAERREIGDRRREIQLGLRVDPPDVDVRAAYATIERDRS